MPRVSSAPEDAYHFKGTFEEGWGKITAAAFVVFQFPPMKEAKGDRPAGYQDPPQLMMRLEIQRYTDDAGNKAGTPPEEVLLPIQKPDKTTGELSACHPGKFVDGNPESEPTDAGGELGAEGDTLFAMTDGYAINEKCKYMRFTKSLTEKGFKPAILKRSFSGDLVGLYGFFKNVQVKGATAEFDGNAFVVDKIVEFPYEKKAPAPAAAASAPKAAKTASKANGAPVPDPAAAAAPAAAAPEAGDQSAEDIAQAIVTETLTTTRKGALLKDAKKLRVEALMCVSKHKPAVPAELKKAVQDFLTEDWLLEFGQAVGVIEMQADGQIQIAA